MHPPVRELVSVSPFAEDHHALRGILSPAQTRVIEAKDWREALVQFARRRCPLIICEARSCWQDILSYLADVSDRPVVIVTSPVSDQKLSSEVVNLGGSDVLVKPLDPVEVTRVVSFALRRGADQSRGEGMQKRGAARAAS